MGSGNDSFKKDEILLLNDLPLAFQSLDTGACFIAVNDRWLEILGYNRQEVIGRYFGDFLSNEFKDDFKERFERFKKLGQINNIEFDILRKDGSKMSVSFDGRVIYDESGRVLRTHCIMNDITDKKIAEERLKSTNKQLEDIIEFLPDATFIIDENKRIMAWNRAMEEMTSVLKKDIIGKDHLFCAVPFYGKQRPFLIDLIFEPESEVSSKYDFVKRKGNALYVEVFAPALYNNKGAHIWAITSPLLDDEGNIAGGIESIRDITDQIIAEKLLKESEEKTKSLNETLRILNKILRHDILNDLTVVMSAYDIMHVDDERLKHKVSKALEKSVSLIEQMRELESALASDEALAGKSLRSVAESVVKNYPDIKFSITGDCTVLCDEAIYSVVDNIVRNAVIHGKTDRIDISIDEEDDRCELRIADYGKGIPNDIKDKIFGEGESFGDTRGSGLGLYIVKKVIERYGGEITVEDNKPSGAVFVLKFKK